MGFGTIFTILGVLFNIWTLVLVVGLVAAAAAIYFVPFFGGPPKLLMIVVNPVTYMAIFAALVGIYLISATHTIEKQKVEIHQGKVEGQAKDDGVAVITDNAEHKQKAQETSHRLQKAIDQAPKGDEDDAVLDQIAREQCSDPDNSDRPDCLREHK